MSEEGGDGVPEVLACLHLEVPVSRTSLGIQCPPAEKTTREHESAFAPRERARVMQIKELWSGWRGGICLSSDAVKAH